jgi:hypothetical protein
VDWVLVLWVGLLLVYSLLEFPLWYMHYLLFFAMSLGMLMTPGRSGPVATVPGRSLVAALAILGLLATAFVLRDYRALERTQFLGQLVAAVDDPRKLRAMNELVSSSEEDVHVFRLYTDYFLLRNVPLNKERVAEKLEANSRLLSRAPLPDVVSRQVLLLALAGDMEAARHHVRRLLTFFPWETKQSLEAMRQLIKARPVDFAALGPILDEELARAPTERW